MAEIVISEQSRTVEIHLPDGRTLIGPRGASAEQFINAILPDFPAAVVGVVINGELHELTYPITMEARVQPITMADADGSRIYRRSLTFLLEASFSNLFPDANLFVDHSVASGGYYCRIKGREPLSAEEIILLENEMHRLVELNIPMLRREASIDEAISYFKSQGFDDKVHLLSHRIKPYVTIYSLGKHIDYHHGYMVPSTGYLKWFEIVSSVGGFTLRFPHRRAPTVLTPMENYPQLLNAFRQYGNWLEKLGIESVGALDDAIQAGR